MQTIDLFWALQGAGHNFGIVTEVTSRIYKVPATGWAYAQYIFTHDKVEAIFAQINSWSSNGTQNFPASFFNKNVYARIPAIDADNVTPHHPPAPPPPPPPKLTCEKAVIMLNIFAQGALAVPTEYTAPLLALGPAVAVANTTDYPGLTLIDGTAVRNAVCQQHGAVNMMFPIRLRAYSIQGQRAAFDAFDAFTADAAFGNSAVLFEGYSTLAVKAVPSDGTAFAFRGDNLLMYVYRRLPLSALRRKTLCLRVQLKG